MSYEICMDGALLAEVSCGRGDDQASEEAQQPSNHNLLPLSSTLCCMTNRACWTLDFALVLLDTRKMLVARHVCDSDGVEDNQGAVCYVKTKKRSLSRNSFKASFVPAS